MPSYFPLKETLYRLPSTLIKSYRLVGIIDGQEQILAEVSDNRQRMVCHTVEKELESIRLQPLCTWGAPVCRVFSMYMESVSYTHLTLPTKA